MINNAIIYSWYISSHWLVYPYHIPYVTSVLICQCYEQMTLLLQGYLLASHLGCADLLDIALYSQYYCLLVLSEAEQMGQVVVWREVFPTDKRTPSLHPQQMGFSPPEARWFLMIVGRVSDVSTCI